MQYKVNVSAQKLKQEKVKEGSLIFLRSKSFLIMKNNHIM